MSSSRHKIVHVLKSAQTEFAAQVRMVSTLARRSDSARYEFHAALLLSAGPLDAGLNDAGVHTEVIGWSGDRSDLPGAWRFLKYLKRQSFSIVHQHFGGTSVRLLARATGVKGVILHLHSRVLENRDCRPVTYGCRIADKVIAVSHAVASRAASDKVEVVYPGVELPTALEQQPVAEVRPFTIGFAGRLAMVKGIPFLLEAVSKLRQEFSRLRLELAGTGPERSALEQAVRSAGLTENVVFLEWQADIACVLPHWDIFVLPSLDEGLPVAALQAMAWGLPVVASSVGGLPELVENGRTGLLVPAAQSAALAAAIGTLLRHPERRRAMGNAGRRRVQEHFSEARMLNQITAIYDRLLADSSLCRALAATGTN